MKKPRRLIASCIWLFALPLASPLHGAPFNERLKAPRATSQQLGEKARKHFRAVEETSSKGEVLIRDPDAYRQWVDLEFALSRAIDEGVSLSTLETQGLKRQPDGSYVVDAKAFPQWDPLDSRLRLLTNPEALEGLIPALQARGFRPEDIETLREYLRTHRIDAIAFPEQKELVESFAQRAAKASKEDVFAYVYQRELIAKEAQRLCETREIGRLRRATDRGPHTNQDTHLFLNHKPGHPSISGCNASTNQDTHLFLDAMLSSIVRTGLGALHIYETREIGRLRRATDRGQ